MKRRGRAASRYRPTEGFALVLALLAIVLLEGFAALALFAAGARQRLASDGRVAVEGDLLVTSVLAEARVAEDSVMRNLPDGGRVDFPAQQRGAGWTVTSGATRWGRLIQLTAEATWGGATGEVAGRRRATLLLGFNAADTLRVSSYRSRF